MARINAPEAHELEVSLFGPGKGECVVVHLGSGHWVVVDSCADHGSRRSIAQAYLERIGVDIETQLKLIVATHWHNDHIAKISSLLEVAHNAKFVCSAALNSREFFQLVAADSEHSYVSHERSTSEFCNALRILHARRGDRFAAGPIWAQHDMRILASQSPGGAEVFSRSPASQTITDAIGDIARNTLQPGMQMRRFLSIGPNDTSVVLQVKTKALNILLGGDLEAGRDRHRGWRAILHSHRESPLSPSCAYKVAHHGSANADLPEIWQELLTEQPQALIAPFAVGRKPLPSPEDVERVRARTKNIFCTKWPVSKSPPTRESAVERTVRNVAIQRRALHKTCGHIRLRVPISGDHRDCVVDLFEGAKRLSM